MTPTASARARRPTSVTHCSRSSVVGVLVAGGLAWYLGRRITRPVLALSHAADEVAGGQYDVEVPPGAGRDEIGHLSERFAEMAERLRLTEELERNFLMSVSHELRTPLTAIRGHVAAPDVRQRDLVVA